MDKFIKDAMKSGQFENTSDYFQHLVQQERVREDKITKLKVLLEKAEASGVSQKRVPEIMHDVENRLRKNGQL